MLDDLSCFDGALVAAQLGVVEYGVNCIGQPVEVKRGG